jgi:putative ATP-dependent endonuclease of OLD family
VHNPATGEFEVNPAGIDAALKNLFPEPVRIEAMVDAPEDVAKSKSTSTLGKIIALLTEPVAKRHGAQLTKLLDQLGDSLSASGANRADELKAFDAEASKILQSFFPGLEILIDFPTPKLPDLLKSGTVKVKEGATGSRREFTELGHGAQRCIQMAMVQLLAIKSQGDEVAPRCTLLLIDEPELYLHPQAIEQVRVSLKRLAQAGYQIIFSTHSPLFVGRTDVATANIIFKRNREEGTTANRSARDIVAGVLAGDAVRQGKTAFRALKRQRAAFLRTGASGRRAHGTRSRTPFVRAHNAQNACRG